MKNVLEGKIGNIPVKVSFVPSGLLIKIEGYGDKTSCDGEGAPILLTEKTDGKGLEMVIWADINQEDPTHTVDLEGALETKREVDEE